MEEYQPYAVYKNLGKFFEYRGVTPSEKLDKTKDEFMRTFEHNGAVKVVANGERGAEMVFIVHPHKKFGIHANNFQTLVTSEEWSEAVVLVDKEFFSKKNMIDRAQFIQSEMGAKGRIFNVYPFCIFTLVVPEHSAVPKHEIISDEEAEKFLRWTRKRKNMLPSIYSSDPPVVWLGARPGQLVRITRGSDMSGTSEVVRHVVRPPKIGAEAFK